MQNKHQEKILLNLNLCQKKPNTTQICEVSEDIISNDVFPFCTMVKSTESLTGSLMKVS